MPFSRSTLACATTISRNNLFSGRSLPDALDLLAFASMCVNVNCCDHEQFEMKRGMNMRRPDVQEEGVRDESYKLVSLRSFEAR